jgi:hypothetical protein
LDRSNNLCMNIKSRDDCLKWKWDGKILKNKSGLVLDIDVNNQRPGKKEPLVTFLCVRLLYRSESVWL